MSDHTQHNNNYNYDNIPEEMKALRQWVCYKLEPNEDGDLIKMPRNPNGGARARSNDPSTWNTFEAAIAASRRYDGIGFIISEDDPFLLIDLDKCVKEGQIERWAQEIINEIDSYTEFSPSRTGIHIIAKAKKPGLRCRSTSTQAGNIEIYDKLRFVVMTGNIVPGTRPTIQPAPNEVAALYNRLFGNSDADSVGKPAARRRQLTEQQSPILSDMELLEKALTAKNGALFGQLYAGDIAAYNYDWSSADQALCNMLAFWTGRDPIQMDRLFRQSGLYRDKWDSKRGDTTYGQMTIDKAISDCRQVYESFDPRDWVSVTEAAEILGICEKAVRRRAAGHVKTGKLRSIRIDGRVMIHKQDLSSQIGGNSDGDGGNFIGNSGNSGGNSGNSGGNSGNFGGNLPANSGNSVANSLDTARNSLPNSLNGLGNSLANSLYGDPEKRTRVYPQTDYGNAERLVDAHSDNIRYCYPWKRWLIWRGNRWCIDNTNEIERLAKQTVRSMYAECATIDVDEVRKALVRHIKSSESQAKLNAMISLAESEPGIPIIPDELDSDQWLLNCRNGTVDLRTGKLQPHDRGQMITKIIDVDYDPSATCPLWEQFIFDIMGGNQTLVNFLQRAVGYSLTGDMSEQVFFILYGIGANGKSTFLNTLRELLAEYAIETSPETFAVKDRGSYTGDIADLKGVRFVVTTEFAQGKSLNEVVVKQLTGGDTIRARRLYQDEFEFKPTFKIWMAANNKPRIRESANAIWRRIRLIPFLEQFCDISQAEYNPDAKLADPQLAAKLKAEQAGILRWAVDGCLMWQKEGLGLPMEVREANAKYRAEMDFLSDFLAECCIVTPEARVTTQELFRAYLYYCDRTGDKPVGKRTFNTMMRERGFHDGRGHANKPIWLGIGLIDEVHSGECQESSSGTSVTFDTKVTNHAEILHEKKSIEKRMGKSVTEGNQNNDEQGQDQGQNRENQDQDGMWWID